MIIYLLITEKCNLNCPFCVRGSQAGHDLALKDIIDSHLSQCIEGNDFVITGGEPSLNHEYGEISSYITLRARHTTITTNGTTGSLLSGKFDLTHATFQVSLDGPPEVHDQARGQGSFERAWATLMEMSERKLGFCVSTVASTMNESSLGELESMLRGLTGLKYWKVSSEMPFGSAKFKYTLPVERWNDLVDRILGLARVRLKIKKMFPFDLYDKHYQELLGKTDQIRFNCGSGKSKVYVYPDLSVYPCTCLKDFCIGNLKEETLADIIHGERNRPFMNYQVKDDPECRKCKYLPFCNGGCIGMAYHYSGGLGHGDIRCPIKCRKS